MVYHPIDHRRRSIRLAEYNYSQEGAYFITICAQDRKHLFSSVVMDSAQLNPAGYMLESWYQKLEENYSNVACDAFIAMPNHIHFIIFICGKDPKSSLPRIIQWFKTMTTNNYINEVKRAGWPAFKRRLWQRNYYERIIRSENDLKLAREYIHANPTNWHKDPYND